ncbi:tRNA 2-thiouridine synthesizing protein A [Amorphus suaedae]
MSTHAPISDAAGMPPASGETALDLRGLNCPLPVLRLAKALRGAGQGARFRVAATDPLSKLDIPHFCRSNGHAVLESRESDGVFHFLIEAGAEAARADPI